MCSLRFDFVCTSVYFRLRKIYAEALRSQGRHRVRARIDRAGRCSGGSMRWLTLLAGLALLFIGPEQGLASSQTQIYWGATIDGTQYGFGSVPHDMRAVAAFETNAGKPVAIIPFGGSWQAGGNWQTFDTAAFEAVRQHGSIPLFSWQSMGPDPSQFTNAIVASGAYDAYIHQWARAAAAWGHPFFLKFDHEMDGSWYPWGEGRTSVGGPIANGNTPGSYVAMYRHVHDIFTAEGATSVTWVWTVNQENTSGRYPPLSQLYPGDAYVDWTGIDAYNRYLGAWQTFNQMFTGFINPTGDNVADTYQLVLNVAPTKPMMIPEFGTIENPTDPNVKSAWLRDAYLQQIPRTLPAVKAVLYYDNGSRNPTLPIESLPTSQAAFANSLASSVYSANTFGTLGTGRIGPSGEAVAWLPPVADTYVASDVPTSVSGGRGGALSVNGAVGQTRKAYLRFDLRSLAGKTVDQSSLQMSTTTATNAGSAGSITVRLDTDSTWTEQLTSWVNQSPAVALMPTPLGAFKPAQPNTTYVATLLPGIIASHLGGLLSIELDTTSPDGAVFASAQAADPNVRPQLVLAYR
jgi:hypothetical protein